MSINDNIVNVDVIIDDNNVVKTVVKSTTVDVNAAVIIGP